MKVVCDNCRAVYKVPNEKLVKAVNKATCRNCRYRMLIPRPNPGADPNERVLVSAVPPADGSRPVHHEPSVPIGRSPNTSVPIRSASLPPGPPSMPPSPPPGGASLPPRSRPIRMPGDPAPVPERALSRATPAPAIPRSSSRPPAPNSWPPSPDPRTPEPHRASPGPSRSVQPMPAPTPPPTGREMPSRPSAPPPGTWVSGMERPSERISYGGPLRTHDPSGDLSWVFVGTLLSAVGALALALVAPLDTLPVVFVGVVLAFGGAALVTGILWTGARGRRKARAPLVVFASIPVAVLAATSLLVVKIAGQAALDEVARLQSEETELEPLLPQLEARSADADVETTPEPAPVEPPPPEAKPQPRQSVARTKPAPAPARPRRPEPARPAPSRPEPARPTLLPPPAPAPELLPLDGRPDSVSGEVVRFMLRDYAEAKQCFVPLAREGILPDKVDTRFKIMPDGTPQDFEIVAPDVHVRGDLERCLRRAITGLDFPVSALGAKVDYPFVLKKSE